MKHTAIAIALSAMVALAACSDSDNDNVKRFKNLVQNHSMFWGQHGWHIDPPCAAENGAIKMAHPIDADIKKRIRQMSEAGIKIHTSIIPLGWFGVDNFDYSETDKTLDAVFESAGKDAYYIPRVKVNVPVEWCAANPQDTAVYGKRLSDAEIVDLIKRGEQDVSGEAPAKKGFKIGRQSFTSEKWLADAGRALAKFVKHIETSKYRDRIIGYHVAFGQCGETTFWRAWAKPDGEFGDWGANALRSFYDWGLKKYGSRQKLADAWNQPDISRETLKLPSAAERETRWSNVRDFFRADSSGTLCRDYDEFRSEKTVAAMAHFAKIAKRESNGKAVGYFYGYYFIASRAPYGGHCDYKDMLACPDIDFIASPKSYQRVMAGDPGGWQNAAQSIARKKIYLDELDNRTHIAKGRWLKWIAADMNETRTAMWRETAKDLAIGAGFWWMDLLGGWFDDPEILAEISKLEKAIAPVRAKLDTAVRSADVLIVSDDVSAAYLKPQRQLTLDQMPEAMAEINLCGAIADNYRLADLEEIDVSKYKVVFFTNCTRVPQNYWRKILPRFDKSAAFVWHYAPAVWSETNFSLANSEKITGVQLREISDLPAKVEFSGAGDFASLPPFEKDFSNTEKYPLLEPSAKSAEKLGVFANLGASALVRVQKDGRDVYVSSLPYLKFPQYRKIMERAGVRFLAPAGVAVYGDSRYTGFFPKSDAEFNLVLDGVFVDAIGGKKYSRGDKISLPAKGAAFLVAQ